MNINVVIIGAGLGGLALGQSLKQKNINFIIYERDIALDSRPQGYRIRIDMDGQQSLKACLSKDLYSLFESTCSQSSNEVKLFDEIMNRIVQPNIEAWDIEGNVSRDLRPNRNTLRELLCKGIEDYIVFGKTLEVYHEHESGGVCLRFADGEEVKADVLVFADGVNSLAGSTLFNDVKFNTGNICVYGKASLTKKASTEISNLLQDGTSIIATNKVSLIVDHMKFSSCINQFRENSLTPVEDYLYWSLVGSCDAFGLEPQIYYNLSQKDIKELVLNKLNHWDDVVLALIGQSEESTLSLNAIRTSNVKRDWQTSQITIIGDAIHAMTPAGGMGANTAFKDAVILANNLQDINIKNISIVDALYNYKNQMLEYSAKAICLSTDSGDFLYGE